MIQNGLVLDTRVFRRLTERDVTPERVEFILAQINRLIPCHATSALPLWAEYVGLPRNDREYPKEYNEFSWGDQVGAGDHFHERLLTAYELLVEKFSKRENLQAESLRIRAQQYFSSEVCTRIPQSMELAHSLIFFKGCSSSWATRAERYQEFLALDALFYNLRFLPADNSDPFVDLMVNWDKLLRSTQFPPVYRFIDSLCYFLEKLLKRRPVGNSSEVLRNYRRKREGLKDLKTSESADCWAVGLPLHGLSHDGAMLPTTLLTFDKQLPRRLSIMIDALMSKLEDDSILETLAQHQLVNPGRIVVLDERFILEPNINLDEQFVLEPEVTDVRELIDERSNKYKGELTRGDCDLI